MYLYNNCNCMYNNILYKTENCIFTPTLDNRFSSGSLLSDEVHGGIYSSPDTSDKSTSPSMQPVWIIIYNSHYIDKYVMRHLSYYNIDKKMSRMICIIAFFLIYTHTCVLYIVLLLCI